MNYQLAQVNIAKFRLPQDNPVNADFVNNLDAVNAIAESQPGIYLAFNRGREFCDGFTSL